MDAKNLKNAFLGDLPVGSLMYPSKSALESGNGNYFDETTRRHVTDDQLFPAVLIDPKTGESLCPTGIRRLSPRCLVGVAKKKS